MKIFGIEVGRAKSDMSLKFLKNEQDYRNYLKFLSDRSFNADYGLRLAHHILKNLAEYMMISKESYEGICSQSFSELSNEMQEEVNKQVEAGNIKDEI